ncbi:MAG: hypothetical protein Q9178_003523 [Gyalolechia marmorata]
MPPLPSLENRNVGFEGRGLQLALVAIIFSSIALATVIVSSQAHRRCHSIDLKLTRATGVYHGVGKHAHTIFESDLHQALEAFYISQIFYKATINSTKISIIFLYRRIFTNIVWFRRLTCVIMIYIAFYAIATILATIFQCTPIKRAIDHSLPGHCLNNTGFWFANAINNIVTDIITLVLPQPLIHRLQMPKGIKVGLYMIFGLGMFVCTTSFLRMTTLSVSSKNPDTTHGTMLSTLWSNVEANTGIICACLPTLKKPVSALYRRCRCVAARSGNDGEGAVDGGGGGGGGGSRTTMGRGREREEGFRILGGMMGRRRGEEGEVEGEGQELPVPMGEIFKRTDVRVERWGGDEEGGEEGRVGGVELVELERRVRGFSGEVERVYPNIVHLV